MASEFDVTTHLSKIEKSQTAKGAQAGVGDFDLDTAWINYGKGGYEYTIADKILKIYVHEDIESFGISGWLDMLDTANLVRNGPINGQELLYMQFATAGSYDIDGDQNRYVVDFTKQPLWIYMVEDMTELVTAAGGQAPQALTYRLHFCSPELLRNERIRISQTMEGSYTDIIKKILTEHLKTTKDVEMIQTTDLKHFVIPNMNPFDVINWATLSSEFQHEAGQFVTDPNPFRGRAADFYFYETTRGYKFMPAMTNPTTDITLTLGNAPAVVRYQNQMATSLEYEYAKMADTRNPTTQGLWGSKHIQHNHFNKSYATYQSNYHRSIEQEQYSYISKTPAYLPTNQPEQNKEGQEKHLGDFPDSLLMLSSVSGRKNSSVIKNSLKINYPWSISPPDLSMRRLMQTHHACDYNLLTARFPGISSLQAGMLVKLRLPDIGTGSGQYDDDPIFVNRLNNTWIIKQLTHVINNLPNERYYHCDVLLSNTMVETTIDGKLPEYTGMGGSERFPNKRTSPHFT